MLKKNSLLLVLLITFFTTLSLNASASERVFLTPPSLEEGKILKKIYCDRPKRLENYNFLVEHRFYSDKARWIVNCYGMGGSGWSVLFGAVNEAIDQFETSVCNCCLHKPIRVIGSGCLGLLCAIELTNRGYKVAGITTKELYDIPSYKAGGLFAYSITGLTPEGGELVGRLAVETYKTYQEIERGNHPYLSSSLLRYLPLYSNFPVVGMESVQQAGLSPDPRDVVLDFGNGVVYEEGWKEHWTYFIEVAEVMKALIAKVGELGIPIEMKEIDSFEELKEVNIFNCSGLGSKKLNEDSQMVAARGHLIVLNEEAKSPHLNYMIIGQTPSGVIALIPKSVLVDNGTSIPCSGVMGTTFIPIDPNWTKEEIEKVNQESYTELLERNSLFYTGHPFSFE